MRKIKNLILLYFIIPCVDLVLRTQIFYYYRLIKRMNSWSAKEIQEWQNDRVKELIKHFYDNTLFYKNLFDKNGLSISDINTVEDLIKIPAINKKIILENYEDLIPKNICDIKHRKASTGGSTGDPLRYLLDVRTWSYTTAIKIYSWQTTSYLYGDKYVALGSSSLFPTTKKSWKHIFYFFLRNGIPLNGMNLSDKKLAEYIEIIQRNKVNYVYGYASALYLLAKFINKNNIKHSIKGCFPTSEILTDSYRKEMELAFNGSVMDCYGARDGGITAYEITKGIYNVSYNSYAEIENCYIQDTGSLLVTDLLNFAFPFIRYQIGDEVEMPKNQLKSNYNGQVFTKILGRTSNIIKLDNGNVLTGPGFTILFRDLNVKAYQISKINGSEIKIKIQRGANYADAEEKLILETFKKHAGNDCVLEIEYIDEFEKNANGKLNYFINS